ncbi:isochorismatase family protein [Acetobacteraceae bacterium]|nr:isochorismatase family protein [Acetobacteraceae bacterium]
MSDKKALLVVDMQNDFMPSGTLPVPKADQIIPFINQALNSPEYDFKVASKDAHPQNHISFQEHGGKWKSHCVKGTKGAEFSQGLENDKFDFVIEKGSLVTEEGYSAFYNAPNQPTKLLSFLKENHLTALYICGVALEVCVKATIEDALHHGFKVFVLRDMIKAIEADKACHIYKNLAAKGAVIL